MGEELNQKLFYAPIGSDCEPIPFDGEVEIDEFPVTETKHDNGLSSFSCQISASLKRVSLRVGKLPRKTKKRLKMLLSKDMGIPSNKLHIINPYKRRKHKINFEFE